MKNNKGITLVALVVTIIVLIILAGISINLILGDNGIITIAKKAKENTELAKIQEETELNELYEQIETEGANSGNLPYDSIAKLAEFKTAIANAIEEAGGIKPDTTAETSVFANNIKGIVKEVTKNATATAEDIAVGKTAYINGELITGTSEKQNSNLAFYAKQCYSTNSLSTTVSEGTIINDSINFKGTTYGSFNIMNSYYANIDEQDSKKIVFNKDIEGTVYLNSFRNGQLSSVFKIYINGELYKTVTFGSQISYIGSAPTSFSISLKKGDILTINTEAPKSNDAGSAIIFLIV